MAQLHFGDAVPEYHPGPADAYPEQNNRPPLDLFSMLKGAFNAVLDLAPALVADLAQPPPPPPTPHSHSYPPLTTTTATDATTSTSITTTSPATVSNSIVPLGPSDHSHRSCVDFLRRLLGAGGATEMRINSLPVRSLCIEDGVEKLAFEQDTCAICLDGYEHNNRVRVLGCHHVFHASCIDPWLRRGRPTCPLCQTICC